MSCLRAAVVILCTLTLIAPARALAQEVTPAASVGEAVDPAACQVEPRSADEVLALWYPENEAGTPVVATPDAEVRLTSVPAPLGEPADAETVEAVTATLREALACTNAGDFRRILSFFTDPLIQQFRPAPGQTADETLAALRAPSQPLPTEQRTRLLAITDISVMADRRIGVVVITDDPTEPPEDAETVVVVLVEESGRWLIDAVAEFTTGEGEQEMSTGDQRRSSRGP